MKLDINNFITTELCPHCNSEVEILNKGISECPVCHMAVLPCSMCDDCDYNHCPYEDKHHNAKIEDIDICSVEILKDILDQFNKNYSIICIGGPRFEIIETSDAFKEAYAIFDKDIQDYYICDGIIQTFDTVGEAKKYCLELNQKEYKLPHYSKTLL